MKLTKYRTELNWILASQKKSVVCCTHSSTRSRRFHYAVLLQERMFVWKGERNQTGKEHEGNMQRTQFWWDNRYSTSHKPWPGQNSERSSERKERSCNTRWKNANILTCWDRKWVSIFHHLRLFWRRLLMLIRLSVWCTMYWSTVSHTSNHRGRESVKRGFITPVPRFFNLAFMKENQN